MTRKWILVGSIVALSFIIGTAITGVSMAQQGKFSHIQAQQEGDDVVVVTVEGKAITQGDVRIGMERYKAVDSAATDDEAKATALLFQIERLFIAAEVESEGITITDDEVTSYLAPHKANCTGPGGEACLTYLREQGYSDPDDYWDAAFDEYKADLAEIKLVRAELDRQNDTGSELTPAEYQEAKREYIDGLQEDASIVWTDQTLRRLYEDKIAEE